MILIREYLYLCLIYLSLYLSFIRYTFCFIAKIDKNEANHYTTSIPQHFDSSSSGIYETTKFVQPPPPLLRKIRSERKAICPLNVSRSSSSLMIALKPESTRSSLLMALKPETSLPNIENGCFMDLPLQQNQSFYPQNVGTSQFSQDGFARWFSQGKMCFSSLIKSALKYNKE